jgi:putative DNA primase/helicase
MSPVERVLCLLPDAQCSGGRWMARCPGHNDNSPSLCISEGRGGRALLHCFAGCRVEGIIGALGLRMRDLYD